MTKSVSEIEGLLVGRQVLRSEAARTELVKATPRWPRALIVMVPSAVILALGRGLPEALGVSFYLVSLLHALVMTTAIAGYEIFILQKRVAALTQLLLSKER